jgi:SAM-dependent methyltransferase
MPSWGSSSRRSPASHPSWELDVRERISRADTYEELLRATQVDPPERQRSLRLRYLAPMQGAVAVMADTGPGSRVLDLSGTCGRVASVHRLRGAVAHVADHDAVRLHVAAVMATADGYVHGPLDDMPYPRGAFDVAHVDVDSIATSDARGPVLAEVGRVLTEDGVLVLTTMNDTYQQGWMGSHPLIRIVHRLWARRWLEMSRALKDLRFEEVRSLIIWPNRFDRHVIGQPRVIRRQQRAGLALDPTRATHPKRFTSGARDLLRLTRPLAPAHCFVAASRARGIASWSDGPARGFSTLEVRFGGVVAYGEHVVRKAALSREQRADLAREFDRTTEAAHGPLARFVPRIRHLRESTGLLVSEVERGKERCPSAELGARVGEVLECAGRRSTPLRDSDVWRIANGHHWPDGFPVPVRAVSDALRPLGGIRVPCGPSHGDLWWGNVLVRTDGTTLLVDWDSYRPNAPLVVDAVTAWLGEREAVAFDSEDGSLDQLIGGRVGGELSHWVEILRGPLTLAEVALLRTAVWVGNHGRLAPEFLWPEYIDRLAGQLTRCIAAVEAQRGIR